MTYSKLKLLYRVRSCIATRRVSVFYISKFMYLIIMFLLWFWLVGCYILPFVIQIIIKITFQYCHTVIIMIVVWTRKVRMIVWIWGSYIRYKNTSLFVNIQFLWTTFQHRLPIKYLQVETIFSACISYHSSLKGRFLLTMKLSNKDFYLVK